ncbi:trissin receptor isoform X3 [Hermetia illucens]|uniref:trissin receptor isoform X3 n=1 Tax=Hermetia illucens TaxID=343691 RepID=UPI0018CC0272|nr:trissin receptor isoform X3 [Hermetia illucens]
MFLSITLSTLLWTNGKTLLLDYNEVKGQGTLMLPGLNNTYLLLGNSGFYNDEFLKIDERSDYSSLVKTATPTIENLVISNSKRARTNNNDNFIDFTRDNRHQYHMTILDNFANLTANNISDYLLTNWSGGNDVGFTESSTGAENIYGEGDDYDEDNGSGGKRDFVFDRTDVKIIFITLYSLVFCCCFFGNLLVILVVTLSRRLRSITNFFLANLAVADFCVGVFCVMQNLSIYLIESWVFGGFLCRMYQFVQSLSYTASIFILVVICMERYFAIIHPITCKQILTPSRLRMVIVGVWITSAVYSTPKFIFSKTITNVHTSNGKEENICIMDRMMFNSKLLDLINFGLLYVTPLLVMSALYSRIAIALWKSSRGLERHIALQNTSTCSPSYSGTHLFRRPSSRYEKRAVGVTESQINGNPQVSVESDKVVVTTWKKQSFHQRHGTQLTQLSHSSNNVLRARRGVIRMLIIVVLTFALCNLPFHARKMWQYWSDTYKGDSNFNALFTPLTFLVTYFNSGVNPLLYAFLSRNFRKGMRELLLCSFKKGKGKSSVHQRVPLQNHSLPTDSTHIGNQL